MRNTISIWKTLKSPVRRLRALENEFKYCLRHGQTFSPYAMQELIKLRGSV